MQITLRPNLTAGAVEVAGLTAPPLGAAPPAAAPQAPSPGSTTAVLSAALAKLSVGLSGDLLALALEHEANQSEAAGARSLLRTEGRRVALDHQQREQQIQKAIDAAKSKSWWSDFTTVFKCLAVAATACTGVTGLVAAGLMATAMIIEKSHPKIALAFECVAAATMVGDAVTSIAGGASSAWGSSATAKAISAGGKAASAVAYAGIGTGTLMTSGYEAAGETAESNQLLWQALVEQQRGRQRENLDALKEVVDLDARATRDFVGIINQRAEVAGAAIRA